MGLGNQDVGYEYVVVTLVGSLVPRIGAIISEAEMWDRLGGRFAEYRHADGTPITIEVVGV